MRFATIEHNGHDEPVVVTDGKLIGLRAAGFADLISVIAGGEEGLVRARSATQALGAFDAAKFRAPIPRPPKIICIGLNYRDHAIESNMAIPEVPTVFSKYSNTITGPGDPIVLPKNSVKP